MIDRQKKYGEKYEKKVSNKNLLKFFHQFFSSPPRFFLPLHYLQHFYDTGNKQLEA